MTANSSSKRLLTVVSVILLGAVLRIAGLGSQSLWLDEFFSFFLAEKDIASIVEGTAQDVLPPLYYFFLHFALGIDQSVEVIRLASVCFSIATLPVIYILAESLFGHRVGALAAFLLAISPLHILFAQEARMYTMFAFFTGLGFFFFWKAWSRDRWSDWLLFSLSMTAAFYTHSLAIFILLAIDVFCLTQLSQLKERWKGLIAAHAAIFLLFLPWALMMFQQLPRLQNEFAGSEQTIATLIETLVVFLFGYSLQPNMIPVALFFALVLIAFILLALWHLFRRKGGDLPGILLALCISVIPVIGVFFMSYVTPVFVIRRLLPASLGLILLASWTIIKAKPKWINYAAGASVVVLMALSLVNYYQHPDDLKIPFHKIIEELQLEVNENAVFVHATDTSALAFAYYAPELNSDFLEGDPDYLAETNRGRAQRIAGLIPAQIDEITGDSDVFWLIVVMDHNLEYQQQIVDQFDSDFTRLQHLTIHDVDILQYSISPSG